MVSSVVKSHPAFIKNRILKTHLPSESSKLDWATCIIGSDLVLADEVNIDVLRETLVLMTSTWFVAVIWLLSFPPLLFASLEDAVRVRRGWSWWCTNVIGWTPFTEFNTNSVLASFAGGLLSPFSLQLPLTRLPIKCIIQLIHRQDYIFKNLLYFSKICNRIYN